MADFSEDKIPSWLLDAFDERTTLPHGPLHRFPVTVEGQIVGGRVLAPKSGEGARHIVHVVCAEEQGDVLRFYREYLPLAGYTIVGHGLLDANRPVPIENAAHRPEIFLVSAPPFMGTVLVTARPEGGTSVEANMAHALCCDESGLVDFGDPRSNKHIHWTQLND